MADEMIREESPVSDEQPATGQAVEGGSARTFIVGVQFRTAGEMHAYIADDADLKSGDGVVVEREGGEAVGMVISPSREVDAGALPAGARRIVRRAGDDDFRRHALEREEVRSHVQLCEKKIADHGLPMKLIDAELVEGGKKIVFFFAAEQRVDFRGLVKDLAATLHRYIEMRQIGSRDASGFLGCMGPCGRMTCCSSFLRQFQSISIAMAKNQGLSPNPAKLTGMCGKLKCCLAYENKAYLDLKKGLPKLGNWVETPRGVGKIVKIDYLRQQCVVRLESGGESRFGCSECGPADPKVVEQKRQEKQQKQALRKEGAPRREGRKAPPVDVKDQSKNGGDEGQGGGAQ